MSEQTPQDVLEQWEMATRHLGDVYMSPKIREAIRAVLERLRVVEADARSDDGCSGDGYRLRQRAEQAGTERDTYRHIIKGVHGALTDSATVVVPGSLEADLYAPVMQIVSERDELRAEAARLRAAAWLVGEDEGCFLQGGSLALLCSDTFGYAVADCEEIDMADAPRVKAIVEAEGWPGVVRWIAERRGGSRPIKEIVERMKLIDQMRLRAEKAEAALRHALEWLEEQGCDCGTDEPGTCALCEAKAALGQP